MNLRITWIYIKQFISRQFVYRIDPIFWVVYSLIWPLISLTFWSKVVESQNLPMNVKQVTTYYLFSLLVNRLTQTWSMERLAWKIKEGKLARFLIMPQSFFHEDMGHTVATKFNRITALLPIFIFLIYVYKDKLILPDNYMTWIYFLLACFMGFLIRYTYDIVIGTLTFFTTEIFGIARMWGLITQIFGGLMIPIALLPPALVGFAKISYTRYGVSFPLEILLGQAKEQELLFYFAIETAWVLLFFGLYKVLWKYGIKRFTSIGI